jgi:hypothetical protein
VIINLLPLLLNVMFGPGAVDIVLDDVGKLPREYVLGRVQSHGDSLAFAHAQEENTHLRLDIGLINRTLSGRKLFIIQVKRCSLLRTNARGDLPSLHEVDSFLRTNQARDRSIVEAVAQLYTLMVAEE